MRLPLANDEWYETGREVTGLFLEEFYEGLLEVKREAKGESLPLRTETLLEWLTKRLRE